MALESATRRPRRRGADAVEAAGAFMRRHRRALSIAIALLAVVGFVVFVVPQIKGLSGTLSRLRGAEPAWIFVALAFEATSLGGYGLLFRAVFCCEGVRIGWREAYQITLAGTVASKLLSTAGAGGVALTIWALRASGLRPRVIARRMLAFELMLYGVFALTLVVVGLGLRTGLMAGESPWTLTVIPAIVGGAAILVTVTLSLVPRAPVTLRESVQIAARLIRRQPIALAGAVGYWGFDIAALWASLHAFGHPPPLATIVMSYFIGQLGNTLPLPGGIGGVEGGMIGALIAFGSSGSLAVLGVLLYRLISFWLPTAPGAIAYLRLRQTVAGWRQSQGAELSTPDAEGDVALAMSDAGPDGDPADLAPCAPAADRVSQRPSLSGDEEVARTHAGGGKGGASDS
ncbi:MAG: flippase-like domain-containing protein [Solirubrobacterales bacterium]|nr:flippase-like domain-containing protein [Solirubrobacterales bacterium]